MLKERKTLATACRPCPACTRMSHPDDLMALWDGATPGNGLVCEACFDEYDCDKCGADMREVSCECYAPIMNHFDY